MSFPSISRGVVYFLWRLFLHSTKLSLCSLSSTPASVPYVKNQQMEPHGLIRFLLDQYKDIFVIPTPLPPLRETEHVITLHPSVGPVNVRPYHYPHSHKEEMEKYVQKMLQDGIIRPSKSMFSNHVLLMCYW